MRRVPATERGAALLTVLLIVALIAVIAATSLEKLRLATRLTGNAQAVDQARAYAFAAETLMLTRIDQWQGVPISGGAPAESGIGRPYQLDVPGGVVAASAGDGGNCFNLNELVQPLGEGRFISRPSAIEQFARLMRLLGIDDRAARGVAAAAADWIDSDDVPQPLGAEDGRYAGYRTGNTLMGDPSELRAVMGVTPAIYAALRPYLCALPTTAPAQINVNTLRPERAALVAMLLPDTLGVARAQAMVQARPRGGYASTFDFWRMAAAAGITPDPAASGQVAVSTDWFALSIRVTQGDTELTEEALVDATRRPARLVTRSWGEAA